MGPNIVIIIIAKTVCSTVVICTYKVYIIFTIKKKSIVIGIKYFKLYILNSSHLLITISVIISLYVRFSKRTYYICNLENLNMSEFYNILSLSHFSIGQQIIVTRKCNRVQYVKSHKGFKNLVFFTIFM